MINNTAPDNPTANRPNTVATSFLVGIVIQLDVKKNCCHPQLVIILKKCGYLLISDYTVPYW